jgi:hypothetical protein
MWLSSAIIGLLGVSGGKIWGARGAVTSKICDLKHKGLEKLLDEKFDRLDERFDRLEEKIDNAGR